MFNLYLNNDIMTTLDKKPVTIFVEKYSKDSISLFIKSKKYGKKYLSFINDKIQPTDNIKTIFSTMIPQTGRVYSDKNIYIKNGSYKKKLYASNDLQTQYTKSYWLYLLLILIIIIILVIIFKKLV